MLAALIATTMSCGDVVREGRSPVFLTIEKLEATPGGEAQLLPARCCLTLAATGSVINDNGQAVLSLTPLAELSVAPTTNNQVTVKPVTVSSIGALMVAIRRESMQAVSLSEEL